MEFARFKSHVKPLALAAGLAAVLGGNALAADMPVKAPIVKAAPVPFFFVNENSFSYSYRFTATDPGMSTTSKHVVSFTHFDVWAYGTNFFTADLLKSDDRDPANPCIAPSTGCAGATEIYGLFRSTLGFNELFKTKAFSAGPLTNVSFEFGADANTMNSFLAPAKRQVVVGLQFAFMLPYGGHLNISPLYSKEWNHNAFLAPPFGTDPSGDQDFDGTWAVETNYAMPLGFLPQWLPVTFSGYANFYGPKGTGNPTTTAETKTEFHSEQKLSLDVGKMVTGTPNMFSVWTAYRYWQNKFGLDHTLVTFSTESTWAVGATIAF
ncbi:MAG: hypothetical protein JWN71_4507 [Xanthobacteraceae bacterium]|nr:hypothetical protein [Xanthobacteraceae bacterium]